MRVFAVIPAFNAEETITEVVLGLKKSGFYVVVVDDGSADRTFSRASTLTSHALRHILNRGQGAALQTGMAYALIEGADVLVHFDADGQHRVEDVEKMIERLGEGDVDVVLSSRILGGIKFSFLDRLKLLGKKVIDRLFSGVTLTDVHSGLRVMNRTAAELIQITQGRMAHATEIISEIRKNNLRFVEVPIRASYTEYSRTHSANRNFLKASLKILKDLVIGRMIK